MTAPKGRELASWADSRGAKRPRGARLSNPFAGFLRDIRQVAKGWRWGSRPPVPRSLPQVAKEPRALAAAPGRGQGVVAARRLVTGLRGGRRSRVVLAHVESPDDLAVLMAELPAEWRVVTGRAPEALAAGRSLLYVTDFAAPESADVAAEAAAVAGRYERDLVPVVVRRLRPEPPDRTPGFRAKGPRPHLQDDVRVRFADPVRDLHTATAAKAARTAVAQLLAEDDATWWEVLRGQVPSPLAEPMAPWRRTWTRTEPTTAAGRSRRAIWR